MFVIFTLICFVVTFYAQNITAIVIAVIIKVLRVGLLPETVKYVARTHKTAYVVYNKFFTIVKIFIRHPQFVTPLIAWLPHFCVALMVAHKFRLCLHPRGMLRVQSLHLPI